CRAGCASSRPTRPRGRGSRGRSRAAAPPRPSRPPPPRSRGWQRSAARGTGSTSCSSTSPPSGGTRARPSRRSCCAARASASGSFSGRVRLPPISWARGPEIGVTPSVGRCSTRSRAGRGRWGAGDPPPPRAAGARAAILESLEAGPLVRDTLARLRRELEEQLDAPHSSLSRLIDRRLQAGIVDLLDDPERRATFDRWVRSTADELLRRHHHQIGITVRENLDALDTGMLVSMIEARVGNDLQFIRLNGAVVGGLVGLV